MSLTVLAQRLERECDADFAARKMRTQVARDTYTREGAPQQRMRLQALADSEAFDSGSTVGWAHRLVQLHEREGAREANHAARREEWLHTRGTEVAKKNAAVDRSEDRFTTHTMGCTESTPTPVPPSAPPRPVAEDAAPSAASEVRDAGDVRPCTGPVAEEAAALSTAAPAEPLVVDIPAGRRMSHTSDGVSSEAESDELQETVQSLTRTRSYYSLRGGAAASAKAPAAAAARVVQPRNEQPVLPLKRRADIPRITVDTREFRSGPVLLRGVPEQAGKYLTVPRLA